MATSPDRRWMRAGAAPVGLVFASALALFGLGASQRDLLHNDEHRYVEISRAMLEPGGSLLVPHLNGRVYTDKPVGFFWAAALLHGPLGMGPETAGKTVSALAGALSVALAFALGRRLYGWREGLAAAAVLASAGEFLDLAVRANLDALLTACTTASLYAWWRGEESGRPAWTRAAGLFAGFGMLVKGPVALVVPAAVALCHAVSTRGLGPKRRRAWAGALAISVLPVALWLAAATAEAGAGYAHEIVLGTALAHPMGRVDKLHPLWFYLENFPTSFLPWSVALPAALVLLARPPRRSADAFAAAWLLAPLILLSLFPAKRNLYLLPLFPGAALVVGRWAAWLSSGMAEIGATTWLRRFTWLARGLLGIAGLGVGLGVVGGAALVLSGRGDGLPLGPLPPLLESAGPVPRLLVLVAGPGLALAGGVLLSSRNAASLWRAVLALGVATSVFLVGFHAIDSNAESTAPFYRQVVGIVGEQAVATYGARNVALNHWLERSRIPEFQDRERAEKYGRARRLRGEAGFLVTDTDAIERYGRPAGFQEVLRYDPPLEPPCLLLRAEP